MQEKQRIIYIFSYKDINSLQESKVSTVTDILYDKLICNAQESIKQDIMHITEYKIAARINIQIQVKHTDKLLPVN